MPSFFSTVASHLEVDAMPFLLRNTQCLLREIFCSSFFFQVNTKWSTQEVNCSFQSKWRASMGASICDVKLQYKRCGLKARSFDTSQNWNWPATRCAWWIQTHHRSFHNTNQNWNWTATWCTWWIQTHHRSFHNTNQYLNWLATWCAWWIQTHHRSCHKTNQYLNWLATWCAWWIQTHHRSFHNTNQYLNWLATWCAWWIQTHHDRNL
jgi:hypothetical protein